MNAVKPSDKQRLVNSAIRSVEVEGLQVDSETRHKLIAFAEGELSAEELEMQVLNSIKRLDQ